MFLEKADIPPVRTRINSHLLEQFNFWGERKQVSPLSRIGPFFDSKCGPSYRISFSLMEKAFTYPGSISSGKNWWSQVYHRNWSRFSMTPTTYFPHPSEKFFYNFLMSPKSLLSEFFKSHKAFVVLIFANLEEKENMGYLDNSSKLFIIF